MFYMDNPAMPQIEKQPPQVEKPIEKPIKKKPKTNPTIILLSVLLMISVLLTALFYLQNQKLREKLTEFEPSPTPTTSPIPTPKAMVDTTGWEIYENKEYGFSLKHPSLDIKCCSLEGPASGEEIQKILTFADKETIATDSGTFDGFSISVATTKRTTDLTEFIEEEKEALQEQYTQKNGSPSQKAGITTVTSVDGNDTIILKDYAFDGNERYYFQIPNFKIMVITKSEQEEGSFNSIFETILSTFKFEVQPEKTP